MLNKIILGTLQGLTEFLPVSSSGHLVIARAILDFKEIPLKGEAFLHLGTLLAVLIFLYKDIKRFFNIKLLFYIVLATIPAGIFGVFFLKNIETIFTDIKFIPIFYLINGIILLNADSFEDKGKEMENLGFFSAIIVGLLQVLSIFPGISRSGTTIFAGILMGLKREDAVKFSFSLAIPAILGGNLLIFAKEGCVTDLSWFSGFIFSFLFGLISVFILYKLVVFKKLKYFAYYSFFIAVVSSILIFVK